MMQKLIVLVFLIFSTTFGQSAAEEDIRSVLDKQVQDWNDGNIEGYMKGYWKSDSLLFTSRGNIQRGWQETLEKYKKSYAGREKMGTLKFSGLQIHVPSSQSAWVFGRWELIRKQDHPHGVFTLVMRKFPEGWRIVHDHTSSAK